MLGNLEFDDKSLNENNASQPCQVININLIQKIADLLEVTQQELIRSLVLNEIMCGKEKTIKPLVKIEVEKNRDSLSKALYDGLFGWLVERLNKSILPLSSSNNYPLTIGLLDIFGFENFEKNSLEQLLINFANEHLQ